MINISLNCLKNNNVANGGTRNISAPGVTGLKGEPMTKAELVEIISDETGINKKDTGVIVNLIMENIGQALVDGDKVELRGFGSFKVKTRQARKARNPRTGADVQVEANRVPFFKASNELKGRLNEKDGK